MADRLEVDLARHVVAWLQQEGWEVYQEVTFTLRGHCADIVVTRGELVGVVECKQSFGLAVFEQAVGWLPYANMVWAAAWGAKRGGAFAGMVAAKFGLGVIEVDRRLMAETPAGNVFERRAPALQSMRAGSALRAALREEHKTGYAPAGFAGSAGRFTPFAETCRSLRGLADAEPGIELTAALKRIKHHYASVQSARSSLVHWIEKGKAPGIRLEREGRKLRLQVAAP